MHGFAFWAELRRLWCAAILEKRFCGGAEAIVHSLQLAKRVALHQASLAQPQADPMVILSIDFSNAFNCMRRYPIAAAMETMAPQLSAFFHWAYQGTSPLILANGDQVAVSATGVRQGDPLGPLFFCLGLQASLARIHVALPSVSPLSYLDDSCFAGPKSHVLAAFQEFVRDCRQTLGLEINMSKCVLYDPSNPADGHADANTTTSSSATANIRRTADGLISLGSPIGAAGGEGSFEQQHVQNTLQSQAEILPVIAREFEAPVAFRLLQSCINTRPLYLMRTTSPRVTLHAAQKFDEDVDEALAKVIGFDSSLPDIAQRIRGLPQYLGGLSLRRMKPTSDIAHAASFLAAIKLIPRPIWRQSFDLADVVLNEHEDLLRNIVTTFATFSVDGAVFTTDVRHENTTETAEPAADTTSVVTTQPPEEPLPLADQVPADEDVPVVETNALDTLQQLNPQDDDELEPPYRARQLKKKNKSQNPHSQRSMLAKLDKAQHNTAHQCLIVPQPSNAAWLCSSTSTSTAPWIFGPLAGDPTTFIKPQPFQDALRLRLMLPHWNCPELASVVRCACNEASPLTADQLSQHFTVCPLLQRYRTRRHNALQDTLAQFLRLAPGVSSVTVERTIPAEVAGHAHPRVDVSVVQGLATYNVDVSVAAPGAVDCLAAGSATKPGIPSKIRTQRKTQKWRQVMTSAAMVNSFRPFVLESTGRLGAKARLFLDEICNHSRHDVAQFDYVKKLRKLLKLRVGCIMASFNSYMLTAMRSNCTLCIAEPTSAVNVTDFQRVPQSRHSTAFNQLASPSNGGAAVSETGNRQTSTHRQPASRRNPYECSLPMCRAVNSMRDFLPTCPHCLLSFCATHVEEDCHSCMPRAMQAALLSVRRQTLSQEIRGSGTRSPTFSEEDIDGDLQRAGFGPTPEDEEEDPQTSSALPLVTDNMDDGVLTRLRDSTDVLIDTLYACRSDETLPLTNNPSSTFDFQDESQG